MAFVLTSISGNLISAASAGYAPTNSADVSAIASAYVDSAVSGKADSSALSSYALSSDVSGVIDTVSSNSASWGGGGGTGDYVEKSATEVAIGSANSAWAHSLAQGISTVASANSFAQGLNSRASSNSFAQGMNNLARSYSFAQGYYNEATANSFAQGDTTRAYSYSFAQGRQITAKNTAAVFGQFNLRGDGHTGTGNSAAFAIGDGIASNARHDLMLVTKDGEITMFSSTADTVGTGIMSSIRAISAASTGGGVDSATVSAIASSYAESAASSKLDSSASSSFYSTANESGYVDSAYVDSAVSGKLDESASSSFYTTANESGFLTGLPKYISVLNLSASGHVRATATGQDLYGNFDYAGMYFRSGSQRPYNIGIDNTGTNFYIATAKNGFERIYASSIQSWNGKLDSSASSSFYTTDNVSGFVDSAYVDSAVSGKADSSALSSYALSSDVSGVIDTVSSNSASWGGVDSATVSAIASSYAESAASSKMDSSAIDYTRTGDGTQIYASGTGSSTNQFSAKNDSAGAAIIAGENARLRLWDTAATANLYASSIGGWNAASNLVSSQSANWGGSALALSAGPGVKLEKSGDTLVASTDETVLWSGETTSITGITLNESYAHFDRVRFYWNPWTDSMSWQVTDIPGIVSYINLSCGWANNSQRAFFVYEFSSTDKLNFSQVNGGFTNITGTAWTTSTACKVYKVVGINRTAEA